MRYFSNNVYRRQAFPFRDTLICYITNNPASSKFYQKMIQSCKHFLIKNPLNVVPRLCFYRKEGWYNPGIRPSNDGPNGRSIYLKELTSKVWITDSLNVVGSTRNSPVITSFMPKIYQCDATDIFIEKQIFSFNDLMLIASECEMLHLSKVVIMNNGEIVPEIEEDSFKTAVSLEAIVQALPNVKTFKYFLPDRSFNIITTKTAQELLKTPHFLSLYKFEIIRTPEIFDINSFYGYIKENKKSKIYLDFSYRQIPDDYKTRLQTIVDEILETENCDYKVPRIYFSGITSSSREKMDALYCRN